MSNSNTSFEKILDNLKDKFNTFNNSNRNAYYDFMDWFDNIEELADTVANNLNDIADDIDDITYDLFYRDSTSDYNYAKNDYNTEKKEEDKKAKTKENEESKNSTEQTVKIDIEKFKEKINLSVNECKLKLEEIQNLIKDFDYASRKSYEDSCLDLQKSLLEDFNTMKGTKNYNEFIEKFNKVIEYINNLYKSAYYKKHNKSSLAFIMDDEDDEINFIDKINADEFVKQ